MALLLLTGCGGRELSDVALIEVLGVDGDGQVTVTGVEGGPEGGVYTAAGADILAAQEALKTSGDKRVAVTHVGQVLLGPDTNIWETLWREVAHRESGYGARVWLCDRPAAELLGGVDDPAGRLKSLIENGGVEAPEVLDAVSELSRAGKVRLPAIGLVGGELTFLGYHEVEGGGDIG